MAEVKRLPNNDATKQMHDRGEIDIYWVTPGYVLARIKAALPSDTAMPAALVCSACGAPIHGPPLCEALSLDGELPSGCLNKEDVPDVVAE